MTDRQLSGAIVLVVLATAVVVLHFYDFSRTQEAPVPPYSDRRSGPVIVELSGGTDNRGVYFLPEKAMIRDLLRAAQIPDDQRFDPRDLRLPLFPGATVTIPEAKGPAHSLRIGSMDNGRRLALDLPIDINQATADDLMLIPGIGEKTAAKILEYRTEKGRFQRLEELMDIKGIKEKRYAKLRGYFFVTGKGTGKP